MLLLLLLMMMLLLLMELRLLHLQLPQRLLLLFEFHELLLKCRGGLRRRLAADARGAILPLPGFTFSNLFIPPFSSFPPRLFLVGKAGGYGLGGGSGVGCRAGSRERRGSGTGDRGGRYAAQTNGGEIQIFQTRESAQ